MKPNTSKRRAGKLLVVGAVLTVAFVAALFLPWAAILSNTTYLVLAGLVALGLLVWAVSAFVEYFRHPPGTPTTLDDN